eukprot:SAG31_NODE_4330_length_3346_cov_2.558054_4_plen_42_part_00
MSHKRRRDEPTERAAAQARPPDGWIGDDARCEAPVYLKSSS